MPGPSYCALEAAGLFRGWVGCRSAAVERTEERGGTRKLLLLLLQGAA